MKRFAILLLLSTPFLFDSCHKDPNDGFIPLNKDFLSYFAFPQGSWWVYKEINSGETDSFYVNSYDVQNIDSKKENMKYKKLFYHLFSKNKQAYGMTYHMDYITSVYEENDLQNGSATRFVYPVEDSKYINPDYQFSIPDHYDSLQINGIWYKDVYRTAYGAPYSNNIYKSEFYARNVGVIKRIYFDGTEWELVKYHHSK